MTKMMKCGHSANATCNQSGGVKYDPPIPCCAICSCLEIADNLPDLTGRMAKCTDCRNETKSKTSLAFFKHNPDKEKDSYYCGCFGWD